ncbi:hypothetical protein ASL11_11910 [Paenibacillus sp. Soil750]|nr:hypothetical protein ASL11_11910 [Paenibacillus sp. Soil750]
MQGMMRTLLRISEQGFLLSAGKNISIMGTFLRKRFQSNPRFLKTCPDAVIWSTFSIYLILTNIVFFNKLELLY